MDKNYYYNFTFMEYLKEQMSTQFSSTHMGFIRNYISVPQIYEARKQAGVSADAVFLSCCYLGYMTKEEMENGNNNDSV